jgi:hypothetical protein
VVLIDLDHLGLRAVFHWNQQLQLMLIPAHGSDLGKSIPPNTEFGAGANSGLFPKRLHFRTQIGCGDKSQASGSSEFSANLHISENENLSYSALM